MANIRRRCERCRKAIAAEKRADARYCSKACSAAAGQARRRARRKLDAAADTGHVTATDKRRAKEKDRDWLIVDLERKGTMEEVRLGRMSLTQAAEIHGVNKSQVKRAMDEGLAKRALQAAAATWDRDPRTEWLLATDLPMPDLTDADACHAWAREATVRFLAFEAEYFSLPGGKPWLREAFHKVWIESVLYAIATGGYLQILSPPRHGKSELLIHFSVWLICRNPDIRVMWVGPNIDISTDMVGSVADHLADNERLIEAVLGPGQYFAPPKRGAGAVWKRTEFRVEAQQSQRKGKTMVAVSRGKKVLSKDCDLIVCDDIEDFDSTVQPTNRRNTRKWFGTQLDSRKEEHTAMVVIGSRQHPDDLYSYNLEDPNFRNIVNSAHASDCTLDPNVEGLHNDCMLFPEIRTYRWLMTKKHGQDAREESGIYEMVYLNDPQVEGFAIFVKEEIEATLNPSRGIGLDGVPSHSQLVAGLDPSATGYQAGFLWAVAPSGLIAPNSQPTFKAVQDRRMRRFMVDIENRQGGGIDHALSLFVDWLQRYGVTHWVIEENGFQRAIRQDPRVSQFCQENNVFMEPHVTGVNKLDPLYGVGAQSRLFHDDLIDLPYGTEEARAKSDLYKRQLLRFTDDSNVQRRNTSDVLMAGWFPQKVIRRWEKEAIANAARVQPVASDYPTSYPQLTGFSQMNSAPWR